MKNLYSMTRTHELKLKSSRMNDGIELVAFSGYVRVNVQRIENVSMLVLSNIITSWNGWGLREGIRSLVENVRPRRLPREVKAVRAFTRIIIPSYLSSSSCLIFLFFATSYNGASLLAYSHAQIYERRYTKDLWSLVWFFLFSLFLSPARVVNRT